MHHKSGLNNALTAVLLGIMRLVEYVHYEVLEEAFSFIAFELILLPPFVCCLSSFRTKIEADALVLQMTATGSGIAWPVGINVFSIENTALEDLILQRIYFIQ